MEDSVGWEWESATRRRKMTQERVFGEFWRLVPPTTWPIRMWVMDQLPSFFLQVYASYSIALSHEEEKEPPPPS